MRRGGKGDAIPLIAFHNAPLFRAGFFTLGDVGGVKNSPLDYWVDNAKYLTKESS